MGRCDRPTGPDLEGPFPVDSSDTAPAEWLSAGFSAADARIFIDSVVPLGIARQWIDAGIDPDDALEYIGKGVPLTEATALARRRVSPDQITRTDTGYEVELEPWQEDPVNQLSKVIEPGRFGLRLWVTPPWGDDPLENEVSLGWDGKHTLGWSVVSGAGLGMTSSVSFYGIAGWPNSRDVQLSYYCDDLGFGDGIRGTAQLMNAAPTEGDPDGATEPQRWVRFANALVGLTDELSDSVGGSYDYDDGYYHPADDEWVDFDDVFRSYLSSAGDDGALPDFGDWFTAALAAGIYQLDEESK
jgi:hypothetical protein